MSANSSEHTRGVLIVLVRVVVRPHPPRAAHAPHCTYLFKQINNIVVGRTLYIYLL